VDIRHVLYPDVGGNIMSDKKKDRTFTIGLTVLTIGWIGCLNPYWIIFVGPVFLVGLVVVWFSKQRLLIKGLLTLLPFLLWYPGFLAFMYFGSSRMTPETFLIPNTFRGQITLIYNEPCGQLIQEIDGRLIYKIPDNGVLICKNKLETGIIDHQYYFVDNNGDRISKIDMLIQQDFNESYTLEKNEKEPPRDKVGLFLGGTGGGSTENNDQFVFHEMHVNSWDSLRVYESRRHDKLVDSLLNLCRQR
jgi:uncharacterized protein DUF6843